MPADGLSTGIDSKISFIDRNGIQQFTYLESLTMKEDATVGKEIQMDGNIRHPKFHAGWSGTAVLQRGDDSMDDYIAEQEDNYYNGIDQRPMTVTQNITEVDGTVTQWQYLRAVLVLEDAGKWSGNEIVKQSFSIQASRRKKIA